MVDIVHMIDFTGEPNGKQKANQTTLATQVVVDIYIYTTLADFSPYVYAASPKTCSFYIKFKEYGLGGIRISNHKSRYEYKWNISVCEYFEDTVKHEKGNTQYYANYKNLSQFLAFMKETFNK